jgi:hypothetical protein
VTDEKPYDQEQDPDELHIPLTEQPYLLDPDDEHVGHPSPDETTVEEEPEP